MKWSAVALGITCMAATAAADFPSELEGTWSGVLTMADHGYWRVEDHLCFMSCTPEAYDHLARVMAYDQRPIEALMLEGLRFMRRQLGEISTAEGLALQQASTPQNDPSLECRPYGLVRQILSPLPIRISRAGDRVVIDYEEWNQRRVLYLDGRVPPPGGEPTAFGHSTARDDGHALIVETVGVTADIYHPASSGGGHSDRLRVIERYTLHDAPRRLELELTLEDPITLRAPYRIAKTWLAAPDVELVRDSCEDVPGKR